MSRRRRRNSLRLQNHDYRQPGTYFVTFCTWKRRLLFGDVIKCTMRLSASGKIAEDLWRAIPEHFSHVWLDECRIMPNHVHGIIEIMTVPPNLVSESGSRSGPLPGSLGAIVGSYKSAVAGELNRRLSIPRGTVWQRGYHDHIIRNEQSLWRIRHYIRTNPQRWEEDVFFSRLDDG